jgi:peptide/nickel transport system substrate-binding protein
MSATRIALAATLLAATALTAVSAEARTLRWARVGDSLTLDPHAQNEGATHTLAHHIYEPLAMRNQKGELVPGLATSWRTLPNDPTVWEFKLRQNVKFHNGAPFNADDVVFSLNRAMQPTSEMKGLLTSIDSVTKVDDTTVHVKTKGPNPLLVNNLTNTFIMDKEWAEANNATKTQDFKNKEENFAVRNANGTGAFQLVSREPDVKTVMKRNDAYWGKGADVPLEISEIIYTPIKSDATRVAALLSGEVDFVQDVPVQDIERLKNTPNLRVTEGPENRTIFFGLNVGREGPQDRQRRGQEPAGRQEGPPGHEHGHQPPGHPARRDARPVGADRRDHASLRERLDSRARQGSGAGREPGQGAPQGGGYENGFQITMHCPNDRYVNDEGICQAVVGMLGQTGIKVNLVSQSKTIHFPLITKDPTETDFFLYGWGVPTFDSEYVFTYLHHSRTGKFGANNGTGYGNPELDKKIQSLATEVDTAKRNATIAEIWKQVQEDVPYIAVHHQMLAYATKNNIDIPVDPENQVKLKYVAFKGM